MGIFSTREGKATRAFPRPPADVWRALVADPTPEEMQQWGVDHYVRESPLRATYRQRGRTVESELEILQPERWLRSVGRVDGAHPEAHEFRLTPLSDGARTHVEARIRLAFAVPRALMRERLQAMLDGVAMRLGGAR